MRKRVKTIAYTGTAILSVLLTPAAVCLSYMERGYMEIGGEWLLPGIFFLMAALADIAASFMADFWFIRTEMDKNHQKEPCNNIFPQKGGGDNDG